MSQAQAISTQRNNQPWDKEEVEHLVGWMEENPDHLRGKQLAWYKLVKEEVFSEEEHITLKKISEKVNNMKKRWKQAKSIQALVSELLIIQIL